MKKSFLIVTILFSSFLFAAEEEEDENLVSAETLIAAVDNLGPTADGFVSEGDFGPDDQNFVDSKILRDFIESRGLIQCRQKCGTLTISGDVRARWVAANEFVNGQRVRGFSQGKAIDLFKSEINLFLDYVTPSPNSWVSSKVRWVNFDGKDGGTATKVEIDRAFIGYDIDCQGEKDFYIEVGRSNLSYMFDSKVEFSSVFDGIHLFYTNCWPRVGTFVAHGGPFIVDSASNHYAWVVEAGINHYLGTGFLFKYSIIDWHREATTFYYGNNDDLKKLNKISNNPRYRFIVSQMLFGYERKIDFLGCKTLYIYGAVLVNHDAKRTFTSNYMLANGAWYAGFTLGKLCKACDWSIDINYQSVSAQAIPEFDLSGIGHGNAANTLFSDAIIQGLIPFEARGFTNYKGWQFNALFALTDTLSLRAKAEWSTPRNASIGGDFFFKAFEMSAIYAF